MSAGTVDVQAGAPQPAACALPYHQPGQRVQFQRWDRDAAAMVTITGTVERHQARALTIRTDSHGTVWTSCGHVIGAAR